LFVTTEEADVVNSFAELMKWVNNNSQFRQAAKEEFARGADGWLVAYARVYGMTLVTHEAHRPNIIRQVPIPNVCRAFGVPCEDPFRMLQSLQVRFEWVA